MLSWVRDLTDAGEYAFNDVFKTVFYAQPGTAGYASGEALVADLNSRKGAQVTLQAYTPLSVELTATQSQETAQVTASATGGIEGTEYPLRHGGRKWRGNGAPGLLRSKYGHGPHGRYGRHSSRLCPGCDAVYHCQRSDGFPRRSGCCA